MGFVPVFNRVFHMTSQISGIASHGSVLPSRGWLITVETPGHPWHPPSTQLDAVVNLS